MSPSPRAATDAHKALLARWRHAMNLVGPGPLAPHFEDAEHAVRLLHPSGRWADLGSGAGFPGVALAAWHPQVQVHLVESRERRVAFLRAALRATGLSNLQVLHLRVEQLPAMAYDGVISRAFAPPESYLAQASRLLVPGGLAVLMAARGVPDDVPGLLLAEQLRYLSAGHPRVLGLYRRPGEATAERSHP